MNILKLLDRYSTTAGFDEPSSAVTTDRRGAFRRLGSLAKDAAIIGLPFGAAMLSPNRAAAQSGTTTVDVLNFALTLEYLEAEYYDAGLDSNGLLSGDVRAVVEQIAKHEAAHVEFLINTINALGGTPATRPAFDFTAGGAFADVFTNPATFLAVAQAFEDTGVRAYKGQAANLMGDVLEAALQIHSVEARHASEIRRLRGSKGWITGAMNTTGAAPADAVYAGEANTTHLGVDAKTVVTVDTDALTEAYDEPLSRDQVLAIASLFIQ